VKHLNIAGLRLCSVAVSKKALEEKKGKKDLLKEGICQNIKHGFNTYYIVEIEEL